MSYDHGSTVDTFASLRFAGEHLEPHTVTHLLKIDPTRSCYRGEHLPVSGRAAERISEDGWWLLRTKKLTRSKTLKDHTDRLLLLLTSDTNTRLGVTDMVQRHSVKLWISLYWFGSSNAAPPIVDAVFAETISSFGGEICIDFHTQSASEPAAA